MGDDCEAAITERKPSLKLKIYDYPACFEPSPLLSDSVWPLNLKSASGGGVEVVAYFEGSDALKDKMRCRTNSQIHHLNYALGTTLTPIRVHKVYQNTSVV